MAVVFKCKAQAFTLKEVAMMTQKIEYPGAEIGQEFEPLEFIVTPELNQQYLYAQEDFDPIYLEATEGVVAIVHPALILNISNDTRSPSFTIPAGISGLHARDDVVFINPARVGKKLTMKWKVTDIYLKRERPYKIVETLVFDEDGLMIMKRLQHITITIGHRSMKEK
jgi:acyl dehydratase